MPSLQIVPACHGIATSLKAGQSIKVINTHGTQVIDTWAFTYANPSSPPVQHLSMQHTHASLNKLTPAVGDTLTSNERKKMLTLVEDTTPGIHDTLVAACDRWRYLELGVKEEENHRNCADNLVEGLVRSGMIPSNLYMEFAMLTKKGYEPPPFTPAPLNLFMNIPVHEDKNKISFEATGSEKGQYVILRAEMDLVVVISACPQDLLPINGMNPKECHFEILE